MVITVTCPSCAASFPVDSNKIPEGGVSARCSSCRQVFRIERPAEPAPPPPAPEPVVAEPPEPEPAPEPPAEPEPAPMAEALPEPEPEPEPEPSLDEGSFAVETEAAWDRGAETDFSVGVDEPATDDGGSDSWVFETEPEIDPGSLDITPVETVESTVSGARDERSFFGDPPPVEPAGDFMAPPAVEPEPAPEPEPEPAPAPAAAPEPAPAVGGFTFGKRDPTEKARRLARVLVSDMIMYNAERHERALANGTLKQDFEEEIQKSWKEYVEQVGEEMATSHPFWSEALNEVLARGEQIF